MDPDVLKSLFKQSVLNEAWPRTLAETEAFDDDVFDIWITDAAREIQRRRGVTTTQDRSLALTPGADSYTLDADVIQVKSVVPPGTVVDVMTGWIPSTTDPVPRSYGGSFPSGQSATLGSDYAQRQAAHRLNRQQTQGWRFSGGKFVLDYVPSAGDTLKLIVEVEDADIANVPDRHRDAALTYLRWCAIDAYVTRTAGRRIVINDAQSQMTTPTLRTLAEDLHRRWMTLLAQINPEAK